MKSPPVPDEVLIKRTRQGDIAAFDQLVRKYTRAAFVVAQAVLVNRSDAEDVCQEAWLKALTQIQDCRQPNRFVFWLLQIVRNSARNYAEYRRVRLTMPIDAAQHESSSHPAADPYRNLESRRVLSRLEKTLAQLRESQREVLLLHDLEGWKHRAIAESLGISEGLSRKRLFEARTQMRALLGGKEAGGSNEERS